MKKKQEIFDDDYYLNDSGKRLIKLALQDIDEAKRLFNGIRESNKNHSKVFPELAEQINELPTIKNPTQILKILTTTLLGFAHKYHIEQTLLLDFLEIVNLNNLENKKILRNLAEALTKSDQVRDDAIRTIIDKMEKDKENIQYDLKSHREDIKKLAESFSQDHQITKYLKRDLKDKAKVADGNE
jgi:hypothetical protein